MFKRTLKRLRAIALAGGCVRHNWKEYWDDARSVSCRYQLTCKRCSATITLYVDGYGKVGAVRSPHTNAHHYADPEAKYQANRRALHASRRADDMAQTQIMAIADARYEAKRSDVNAQRQAKAAISWRVNAAPTDRRRSTA